MESTLKELRQETDQQVIFRTLVENSAEFVALTTASGKLMYVNSAGRRMLGLDEQSPLLEKPCSDICTPDSQYQLENDAIPTAVSGQTWRGDLTFVNQRDSNTVIVRGSVSVVESPFIDQPRLFAMSFLDVTEICQTEEKLRRQRDLLTAVAIASNYLLQPSFLDDTVEQAIAVIGRATGADRVVVMTCCALEQGFEAWPFCAWSANEADLMDDVAIRRKLPQPWQTSLAAGQPVRGKASDFPDEERALLEREGVLSTLTIPILLKGELWGYVGFDDTILSRQWTEEETSLLLAMTAAIGGAISRFQSEGSLMLANQELTGSMARQKTMGEELARAKEAADQASRAKSEFLANMSHEIRTPMTAILGFSDLLVEDECSAEERAVHLKAIRQNGRHLLMLINDILDISKIEAGKMDVEAIDFSPFEIVSEVTSMMRGRATEKGIGFRTAFATAIPRQVKTDPTRLRQILINLLGNAIKFTKTGGVRLEVELVDTATPAGQQLRFKIHDSGIGMTPDQIANLFGAFKQADTSTTRKFGGTGLGLYVSKRLAIILGGDLIVESQYGVGSTFIVNIAIGAVDASNMATIESLADAFDTTPVPKENKPWEKIQVSGRVLLAEDGPDNQRLITLYLTKAGAKVEVVGSGRQAVDRVLAESAAGTPFDAVLMDIQMPELDGYAAVGLIRAAGDTTPVVALTAHAMASDRVKCLAAGFSDYATKPIDRAKLLTILATFLQKNAVIGNTSIEISESPVACPMKAAADEVVDHTEPSDEPPAWISDFESDPDMVELLEMFAAEIPATADGMIDAFEHRDETQLRATVHRLKGSSGNYGYMKLSKRAFELDDQIETNIPWDDICGEVYDLAGIVKKLVGRQRERRAS